jgi:hypothetical protein
MCLRRSNEVKEHKKDALQLVANVHCPKSKEKQLGYFFSWHITGSLIWQAAAGR